MDISIFGMAVDPAFFNLALGLLVLILANIMLGSMSALFNHEFDAPTFFEGCLKGVMVAACAFLLYLAGLLNPDVVAIEFGDESLTILTAINAAVLAGYYLYAKQVFEKLVTMLTSGTITVETTEATDIITEVVADVVEDVIETVVETVVEPVIVPEVDEENPEPVFDEVPEEIDEINQA